ncbi:sulfite exporter TauE/SafE family protein [Arthrobacter sp. CDRTa11]|uniref:sulfite exporter TauE/SafE family protein n=1 Tax=Arthrobacter sp. CDRTa11 TaxID=2651199 RepID=UPI002265A1EF|nr:sulfite exporter TauE/SafE family protein [Arthrobacter sp. CDRTa11]UZX02527.1 sulfite exporter TauE/SafE family protein [Arthrobacter sp. CDRTa11]
MFALVLIAVVAGALAQRLAGLGFGLLVSPVLVVLLGPFDGVLIINLCGAASSLLILSRVWRFVDWQRYFRLALAAVAGVLPGAWLASNVPEAPLEICIGVLLFIALLVSQRLTRSSWHARGPVPLVGLGFSSGLMNAAAGVGGPAITAYAIATRWEQKSFSATLQPYFVTTGLSSLVSKYILSGGHVPALEGWQWLGILAAMVAGIVAGDLLSGRVHPGSVRRIVVGIAYLGAASTLAKGLVELAAV